MNVGGYDGTEASPGYAALQVNSNRLPIIASSINDHLAAAEQATKRGLEHAIAAGALLIEAKSLVDHGGWLPWLEANCRVGVRQAQTESALGRLLGRGEVVIDAASDDRQAV